MPKQPLTSTQKPEALFKISACSLFRPLGDDLLEDLVNHVQLATLVRGEVLFDQGDSADHIFVLQSGHLKLVRMSAAGGEKVLEFITPGESFAEAVMFSDKREYPVTSVALVNSQVWCIESQAYKSMLHGSSSACFAVMAELSRRIHQQVVEIDYLTLHSAVVRLAAYLLDQPGVLSQTSAVVNLGFPKVELASRLSIKPETLSRTFARLSGQGLIAIDDSKVTLLDVPGLQQLVSEN